MVRFRRRIILNILYNSTRGINKPVTASEAIIRGIAEDGGLFVPETIPKLNFSLQQLMDMDYRELAYSIMSHFLTDFSEEELRFCVNSAYDTKFDTELIAPVEYKGDAYFLELYHGPTLAFKDMALTILPYLLKTAAKKLSIDKEIVILTATSGDTGKAALEGFANVDGTKIVVYFPEYGVSQIQKQQMVTQEGKNTYVIGIEGNFDDAQNGVKRMFTDNALLASLDKKHLMFSSANSINIGRLIPQVVYYFHAYFEVCRKENKAPGDAINFTVPTGNFGNILAGYYAKTMGLPIKTLICASNENKVLFDFIKTGVYDRKREFIITMSPSMDILISSNLERLLYAASGNDAEVIARLMKDLSTKGEYIINDEMKKALLNFYGGFASESQTAAAINKVYNTSAYLIDPHTAVAYSVYENYKNETGDTTSTVIVSTASPYKFTTDVMKSIDQKYKELTDFELIDIMAELTSGAIPEAIKGLQNKPRLHKTICKTEDMQLELENFLN